MASLSSDRLLIDGAMRTPHSCRHRLVGGRLLSTRVSCWPFARATRPETFARLMCAFGGGDVALDLGLSSRQKQSHTPLPLSALRPLTGRTLEARSIISPLLACCCQTSAPLVVAESMATGLESTCSGASAVLEQQPDPMTKGTLLIVAEVGLNKWVLSAPGESATKHFP